MPTAAAPPSRVLAAFGLRGATVTVLPGGQGSSWLVSPAPAPAPAPDAATGSGRPAAPLVLKPVEGDLQAEEVAWLAEVLAPLCVAPAHEVGFRLPAPVPGPGDRWVVDGWSATTWAAGEPGPAGRWVDLLATARAFSTALAPLPRPGFLERRTDPWAVADRAAWGEQPLEVLPDQRALVDGLRQLARRGDRHPRADQLVHGDMTGNVLFAEGLPPAVIDVSPYWRPAAYAGAVVVADGLLWWGQDGGLVSAAGESGDVGLVARALLFRLLTDVQLVGDGCDDVTARGAQGAVPLRAVDVARYRRALDVLGGAGA
ncbi:aminoglycoside phosphotransferase [Streptomyces sp. NP160]|uniref:aminoglycoside phosphotransferase n=1 Tax=Streptomyces sp. NP160 TaxID=2586637 RepID=UPI0011183568|nr:aminoglycoside phosphotransferase [Streptomyces sp. NP160]TNM61119.1 aminoglycoside phosphotransferase [Streptomyces sp. NP160]